jgi:chloride channel protein, CIC family
MSSHDVERASTTSGLPLSVGLAPLIENAEVERHPRALDKRSLLVCALCMGIAAVVTVIARLLVYLIGLITNIAFYGQLSGEMVSPAGHHLGTWVILVPIVGSGIVGLMARYGAKAIRGHGIPEAMEQILTNESRIPVRMTFLKPLSAAISIGTGGPFGAEGPIIATGGALGSLFGQHIEVTAHERKVLLAAGAAGGMTAIFATPFAAILLSIELLVFEFRPRSFVPIFLSVLTAMAIRPWLFGTEPVFSTPIMQPASLDMLLSYAIEGLLLGAFSVAITKAVYQIEDLFERLPIHWMWWPAIGGVVVGLVGFVSPDTMGVGYENIERILSGHFLGPALGVFCLLKFISWAVALGSGTSGGTLAPLFTIGGALGVLVGQVLEILGLAIDFRMAALVGMAACFAGASRALFASIVFAVEITGQFNTLLPLMAGCVMAFLISAFGMRTTIMTEKLSRRGTHVPADYVPATASPGA